MKNKNKKLIVAVLALVGAMLLSILSSVVIFTASASDDLPKITLTYPTKDDYGYCTPDGNNMMYFTFKLDKDPGENDVVVYFHAEDRSAVSAAGDYYYNANITEGITNSELASQTHATSNITLNSSNYKSGVTIGYYVGKTDYASLTTSEERVNYFIFKVDAVENAQDFDSGNIKCRMSYKYKMGCTSSAMTQWQLWNYGYTADINCQRVHGGDTKSSTGNLIETGSTQIAWYEAGVTNGLGHLYTAGWYYWLDSSVWSGYDYHTTLYVGTTAIVKETIDDILNEKYEGDDEEHMDFDEDKYIKTYFTSGKHTFFQIPADAGYSFTLSYHTNGDGALWREGDVYLLTWLLDDSTPTYQGAYIDSSSLFTDGKIRVMLRFSEPVHTSTSYINAKLNGRINCIFRYAEGSGTNTLVYEANVNSDDLSKQNMNITSVTLSDLANYKDISDMGKNKSNANNSLTSQPIAVVNLKCSIDLRTPDIADAPYKGSNDITSDRSVSVTIEKLVKGTLYYCWTRDRDANLTTANDYETLISAGTTNDYYAGKKTLNLLDLNKTLSVTVGSPSGIDGEYYLHLLVVSSIGKTDSAVYGRVDSNGNVVGGYYFDNHAPTVTVTENTDDSDGIYKYFTLSTVDSIREISKLGEPSGIYRVGIEVYNDGYNDDVSAINLWVKDSLNLFTTDAGTTIESASISNAKIHLEVVHVDAVYESDNTTLITAEHYELQAKGEGKSQTILTLDKNGYGKFFYRFYVEDIAGNIVRSNYTGMRYDTRDLFKSSWEVEDASQRQLYTDIQDVNIFDINLIASKYLTFVFTDLEYDANNVDGKHDVINIDKIYYGESETPLDSADYSTYVTITQSTDGRTVSVTPLKTGFYCFELNLTRLGSTLYGGDGYEFYVTDHSANADTKDYNYENTVNYEKSQGNLVLNNQVRQLGTSFYYCDATGKVCTTAYNDCSSPASFSSAAKAKEYLLYMEYQDLYLVQLDNEQIASLLNAKGGGSTEYKKADGQDNITAAVNQTWIRYKRSSWTVNAGAEGWAYYYYCQGYTDKINISSLPSVLTNAIDAVVDYLDTFATDADLVQESSLDSNHAPYLLEGQIHYNAEASGTTKAGSTFFNAVTYDGDVALYDNVVKLNDDKEYPMATNLQLTVNKRTKLYYISNTTIHELNAKDGDYLGALMDVGTGTYEILELDGNGLSKFSVYIDKSAPVVTVSYTTAVEGYKTEYSLSENFSGSVFSAKSFMITTITGEYDTLSYVAVYGKSNRKLIAVYYYNEILLSPIVLEDGNYYVEVCDRSGNYYSFTAQVCSEPLTYVIKVVDDSYLYVSTNRTEEQMLRYEVTCNNVLIDEPYTGSAMKYKQSGYYNIYIEDIYGFTNSTEGSFGINYQFERPLPEVTWSYATSSGSYATYDAETTKVMSIVESISPQYLINTSRRLRFSFTGDYVYEFTGLEESEYSYNTFGHYVSINSDKNWKVKIYYKDYPDIYVIYICTMDQTPPLISSSYKVATYGIGEESEMTLQAKTAEIGDIYLPASVEFIKNGSYTNGISEGDYVTSGMINLDVTDTSGVYNVTIYKDDKLVNSYTPEDNKFTPIVLSEEGAYYITATDIFGNQSTLSFYNLTNVTAICKTDGNVHLSDGTLQYGNTETEITTYTNGQLLMRVAKGEDSYFLFYTIADGKVTITRYICEQSEENPNLKTFTTEQDTTTVLDAQGQSSTVLSSFFDKTDVSFTVNKWYHFVANDSGVTLYSETETVKGVDLYVKYDLSGNISMKFEADETERISVEASFFIDKYKEPYYFKSLLSKEVTDVRLQGEDGFAINTGKSGEMVRINQKFSIINSELYPISDYVTSIEMEYSATRTFKKATLVYPVQDGFATFETKENGFYLIKITNIFGNVNQYIIHKSDVFTIVSYAVYDDMMEARYTTSYDGSLRANNKIGFEAYADSATFYLKNLDTEETTELTATAVDGCYYLVFNDEGSYELTLIDNFGNRVVKNFEIKKTNLVFEEDFITGYNENAKKLSEGYTNQKLTIEKAKVEEKQIQYISVIHTIYYEDKDPVSKETVLYDNLSETKVALDVNKLTKAVGNDGDGEYTIIFRDYYGSIAKKVVHYMGTPTLTVSRQIRSSATPVVQDLNEIVKNGVWSNSQVIFSTTATDYDFNVEEIKISDKSVTDSYPAECPKTFSFPLSSGNGKRQYRATYLDEYGYSYTIDIYLVRQDIEITFDESVVLQDIDEVLTTRNNIKFTFTENSICTYRLNSGEEMTYNAGDSLYKDGTYRFTVTDYAGNVTTKNIKKDTTCEFKFYVKESDKTLLNGDVVNSGKVTFSVLNNDTVYIAKYYLDGELQSDEGQTTFQRAGKYNMMIEDKAGNSTMFEFYIITHDLSFFEYTTPANYTIEAFWYDAGDGILIDEMVYVTQDTENNTSYFTTANMGEDINGTYSVVMSSSVFAHSVDFTFTINTNAPKVSLNGCEEGETTVNAITLNGCKTGDTVYVYKDGVLIETKEISGSTDSLDPITDGGKYVIVVENEAGVTSTLKFTRTSIVNGAGSALIIILCLAMVAGLIIGMILRNCQKVDD